MVELRKARPRWAAVAFSVLVAGLALGIAVATFPGERAGREGRWGRCGGNGGGVKHPPRQTTMSFERCSRRDQARPWLAASTWRRAGFSQVRMVPHWSSWASTTIPTAIFSRRNTERPASSGSTGGRLAGLAGQGSAWKKGPLTRAVSKRPYFRAGPKPNLKLLDIGAAARPARRHSSWLPMQMLGNPTLGRSSPSMRRRSGNQPKPWMASPASGRWPQIPPA
mgnify:CR=1 FL=1